MMYSTRVVFLDGCGIRDEPQVATPGKKASRSACKFGQLPVGHRRQTAESLPKSAGSLASTWGRQPAACPQRNEAGSTSRWNETPSNVPSVNIPV